MRCLCLYTVLPDHVGRVSLRDDIVDLGFGRVFSGIPENTKITSRFPFIAQSHVLTFKGQGFSSPLLKADHMGTDPNFIACYIQNFAF